MAFLWHFLGVFWHFSALLGEAMIWLAIHHGFNDQNHQVPLCQRPWQCHNQCSTPECTKTVWMQVLKTLLQKLTVCDRKKNLPQAGLEPTTLGALSLCETEVKTKLKENKWFFISWHVENVFKASRTLSWMFDWKMRIGKKKNKSLQHLVFPSGHPSKY